MQRLNENGWVITEGQEKSVEVAQDESESLDMLCATASWLRSNFKDHLMKAGFFIHQKKKSVFVHETHTHTHTHTFHGYMWLIGSMAQWSWLTLDLTGRFAFRCALIWMVSILEPRAVRGLGWSGCHGQSCKSSEIHLVEVQASRNDWKGSGFLHFRYLKFLVTVSFGVSFIEASKSSQQNLRFPRSGPSKLGFWWDAVWSCHASLAPGQTDKEKSTGWNWKESFSWAESLEICKDSMYLKQNLYCWNIKCKRLNISAVLSLKYLGSSWKK